MRRAADKLLADIGLPSLPASLFASEAMLADLILQPCTPLFEFPLRESEEKVHFIGALLPSGAGDVPAPIKEAKKAGRKMSSSARERSPTTIWASYWLRRSSVSATAKTS